MHKENKSKQLNLKSAIENNDTDKIMEANDKLTQLAVEKEKAKIHSAQKEEKKKQVEETPKQETQAPAETPVPQPASPRAQEWAEKKMSGLVVIES